jgi:hypothetical protein
MWMTVISPPPSLLSSLLPAVSPDGNRKAIGRRVPSDSFATASAETSQNCVFVVVKPGESTIQINLAGRIPSQASSIANKHPSAVRDEPQKKKTKKL